MKELYLNLDFTVYWVCSDCIVLQPQEGPVNMIKLKVSDQLERWSAVGVLSVISFLRVKGVGLVDIHHR